MQLAGKHPREGQQGHGFIDQTPERIEPVASPVKRERRLEDGHFAGHIVQNGGRNVRRIRDDEIERRIGGKRRAEIAFAHVHAIAEAEPRDVAPRERDSIGRDVGRDDARVGMFRSNGAGDAARTGADIGDGKACLLYTSDAADD